MHIPCTVSDVITVTHDFMFMVMYFGGEEDILTE